MVTREKIADTIQELEVCAGVIDEMRRLCVIALTTYKKGEMIKTLPQEDIDDLIRQFTEKRDSLISKLEKLA